MEQLAPETLRHFRFRQAVLLTSGITLTIENVHENTIWLQICPSPELNYVVPEQELRDSALAVFRFLPYRVFVTVTRPPLEGGFAIGQPSPPKHDWDRASYTPTVLIINKT